MSSVQERLQIKRTALDKWSIKERLCLASAVHCSGDQNWMSVSRSLKLLCSSHNRPPDWFSQKSCAVQYGELLENVETPKRKKRSNSDNPNQPAETPTESILRNLKQERINELETLIQNERKIFLKLHKDALSIQNNSASDEQIRELWLQIQKEKEEKVLEEQKYNEWLKEREQRKLELQRAWRPVLGTSLNTSSVTGQSQASQGTNLKHEDMDIDETITPISSSIVTSTKPQQTATSPLLTSLLKTPSSTVVSAIVVQTSSTTSPRIQAPTITNLLTGGQLPPNVTHNQPYKIAHPLIHMSTPSQVLQSPSQSAPTLSMLLENKNTNKESIKSSVVVEENKNKNVESQADQAGDGSDSPNKDELMEVFKGLIDENIDENIEELAEILTNNNAIIPEILDEALENVDLEEQLSQENSLLSEINEDNLEGNSKNHSDESSFCDKKLIDPNDLDTKETKIKTEESESVVDKKTNSPISDIKEDKEESESSVQFVETKEESQESVPETKPSIKTELLSFKPMPNDNEKEDKKSEISEDSGDMTFQEIANEIKEKIKAEEGQDSKESSDDVMEITDNLQSIQSLGSEDKKSIYTFEDSQDAVAVKHENIEKIPSPVEKETTKKSVSESSDIILIQEDEDSNEKDNRNDNATPTISTENSAVERDTGVEEKSETEDKIDESKIGLKTELDKFKKNETTTITIIDTDDDSTLTDTTIKDDKLVDNVAAKNSSQSELEQTAKLETQEKRQDEHEDDKKVGTKKEDCETSIADEDINESLLPRTKRRTSSTTVIDSFPSSPASSVEIPDQKVWKKTFLTAYSKLLSNKNSSYFMRFPNDDQASKYTKIILHPMDMTIIKKNIDTGVIKTISEFQRDLMLMCINAVMFYDQSSEQFVAANEFLTDVKAVCLKLSEKEMKKEDDNQDSTSATNLNALTVATPISALNSSKIRSRKSQRF